MLKDTIDCIGKESVSKACLSVLFETGVFLFSCWQGSGLIKSKHSFPLAYSSQWLMDHSLSFKFPHIAAHEVNSLLHWAGLLYSICSYYISLSFLFIIISANSAGSHDIDHGLARSLVWLVSSVCLIIFCADCCIGFACCNYIRLGAGVVRWCTGIALHQNRSSWIIRIDLVTV